MIEAIIKRIQDGGFEVLVVTHMLVCRKWHATGECYGFDWMISKEDLACRHAASLLDEADQRIRHERDIQQHGYICPRPKRSCDGTGCAGRAAAARCTILTGCGA